MNFGASFERKRRLLDVATPQREIQRPSAGYDAPMEALWKELKGELERFARARTRDPVVVDDVVQTAFLRAHARAQKGDLPVHPRAWLYEIVRNLLHDVARSDRRNRALVNALEAEKTVAVPMGPPPATEVEENEAIFGLVARALPIFIERLDPPYRRALQLTEIQGLTQAEAARLEGVSVSAMKSRVQRGRRQVFEALQRCCRFEVDGRGRVLDFEPRSPEGCTALRPEPRRNGPRPVPPPEDRVDD